MRGKTGKTASFRNPPRATFTPVDSEEIWDIRPEDILPDDATFEPVDPEEGFTKSDLDALFTDSDEDRFLRGEPHYVSSSNVSYFQYMYFYPDGQLQQQLYVGFLDGSVYEYDGVSLSEALIFFRAASPGGAVWDHLRVRGTVFGYQKPYRLVSGNRVWQATQSSIGRHEAIPASGEPFPGYHPTLNWSGATGKMGATSIDLGKKGSKKVAYFTRPDVHLG